MVSPNRELAGGSMATVMTEQSPIEVLERRLEDLLVKYEKSRVENTQQTSEIAHFKQELIELNAENKQQRQEIASLRQEIADLKQENALMRQEGNQLKQERDVVKERINKLIGQVDEHLQQLV